MVCRSDKGFRAQARVVYSHLDAEGRRHIGVELLDREDFWDQPPAPLPRPCSPPLRKSVSSAGSQAPADLLSEVTAGT